MVKRTITLVVEILDLEQSSRWWDAHRDSTLINGSNIVAISNGDVIAKTDKCLDEISKILESRSNDSTKIEQIEEIVGDY